MPNPVIDKRQFTQNRPTPVEPRHQEQFRRLAPTEEVQDLDAAYRRTLGSAAEPPVITRDHQIRQNSPMRFAPPTHYWVADSLKKGA